MIASEDVRRVTFDRTMRGYRCEDVDDYLKQVADSMDALAAEHEDMQKKIMVLAQRIDQYRADEDTLRTTMLNAQRLGENVIKEAKQKAAEIIRDANIRAEDREQRARDEVALCQQEVVTLHREADGFKKGLMKMYKEHIELITKLPSYVEEEAEPAAPEEEYEQQQFDPSVGTTYYQPEPESAPVEGEAVDTVEFGMDTAEEPEEEPEAAPAREDRFAPGAGLYDLPEAPAPRRSARKEQRRGSSVPEGLESFAGVDFDS